MRIVTLTGITALCLALCGTAAGVEVDPNLPAYTPVTGISGTITTKGSDTMAKIVSSWGEKFKKYYPAVRIEVESKGSGTAPPALAAGTSTFGPMSRKPKDKENDAFEGKRGYKITVLDTAIDMLAVFAHKDNPVPGLTLQQVDAIFSKTRKGGAAADITTWGQAGLTGEWAAKSVALYGRNSASGTYGFFAKKALFKGEYKDTVNEQGGSAGVINAVANDQGGIGYSGIGYKTADVKAVPLAAATGEDFVAPTVENVADYPLTRSLYLAVDYKPGSALDPIRKEFLKLVFSKEGQESVVEFGYLPVSAKMAKASLEAVGIK